MMFENALLVYVNIKNHTFNNANFNFDNEFDFHLNIDENHRYILSAVRKPFIPIPNGFWGKNIKALNVIVGENGAGKTSFFRFICNNLAEPTAMNSEDMLYIIRNDNCFYYFTNIQEKHLIFDNSILNLKNNFQNGTKYISSEWEKYILNKYLDNHYIWRNVILYSNNLDLDYYPTEDDFIIDISKNKRISNAVEYNLSEYSEKRKAISKAILGYSYKKILKYFSEADFKKMSEDIDIKLPTAISFNIKKEYDKKYNKLIKEYNKNFPNSKFICKKRYEFYKEIDRYFEFEAALNKFSFILMHTLLEKQKMR